MLSLISRGFIRFDVEDFLTPESDEALWRMWETMQRHNMPGSYGLVGKKVQALFERGYEKALRALRGTPALGFHSLSHSEHPTLAEEAALLSYEEACDVFIAREGRGVTMVKDLIKPPTYFTQPGGNWVPEAVESLPQLGMDVFFTDSFNSYVVDLSHPYWYGEILHLSFPVINPRPFGLGLPHNLDEAVSLVDHYVLEHPGDAFMVMLHPTELVTKEFWDVVNFPHGTTVAPLRPAPVRSSAEQDAALKAFDRYIERIKGLPVKWGDVSTLRDEVQARGPVTVRRQEIQDAIVQQGWGPMEMSEGTLSAAEALYALAMFVRHPRLMTLEVPYVGAPHHWMEQHRGSTVMVPLISDDRAQTVASAIIASFERSGRLPSGKIAGLTLQEALAALTHQRLLPDLAFLGYIKETAALHWDWPIFPPGFSPLRLWQDARRLAWTLKRAPYRSE